MRGFRDKDWYPYAVAACIAVAFYVILANIGGIWGGFTKFLSYFHVVFLGAIFAYVMNPLAKLFQRTVFRKVQGDKVRWYLSIAATIILVIAAIAFLLGTLIPQLVESAVMLANNMEGYLESLRELTVRMGLSEAQSVDQFLDSSGNIAKRMQDYLNVNAASLVNISAAATRSVTATVIAVVLSVYMLAAKDKIKNGIGKLLSLLMSESKYESMVRFLSRCDKILVSYIVSTLLDAAIVGIANAIFMGIMGMEYIGLISVVVAVANLVPTFGPIVGGAIGAFILLLVKPVHALIFIIFTFILQFIDPYFIKPKLFGNTLGVSGLLILVFVLVLGSMFGISGILVAIPLAAIAEFVYEEGILVYLEARKQAKAEQKAEE